MLLILIGSGDLEQRRCHRSRESLVKKLVLAFLGAALATSMMPATSASAADVSPPNSTDPNEFYFPAADPSEIPAHLGAGDDVPFTGKFANQNGFPGEEVVSFGVHRGRTFTLVNGLNTVGVAGYVDIEYVDYGRVGDVPVIGDWDGDGIDGIGVFRNGLFLLRDTLSTGPAQYTISYGRAGDQPISGDWDGDGVDEIGIRRGNVYYLRGTAQFTFGLAGDQPVMGDWDNNGTDTIGAKRGGTFRLTNNNVSTAKIVNYGRPTDLPVVDRYAGYDQPGVYRQH